MTKVVNRTCIICGEKYSYCNHCSADANKPSWYNEFESENCRDIYDICANYWAKKITHEKAYEMLKNCDLSKKGRYNSSTKKIVEEIMSYKPAIQEKTEKQEDAKATSEPVKKIKPKSVANK